MNNFAKIAKLVCATLGAAVAVCAIPARAAAQEPPAAAQGAAPVQEYSVPDAKKRAEAFFNFTMGHLNEIYYLNTNRSEFATAAIGFYKKAYELDPNSPVIAEYLAEMYYEARRISDAVLEAQNIIQKDPANLPARRLLVRVYLRTLGDLTSSSAQQQTATRAVEQLEQIRRLDPNDAQSALWLARIYRMRGEISKAETVLRDLLSRNPNDAAAAEQIAQLLLEENRSREAVTLLEGVIQRAPTGRLLDLLGGSYLQTHDFPNAEQAFRKAMELEPEDPAHQRGLAQALAGEEKYEEARGVYKRMSEMEADEPDNYLRMAEMDRHLHRLDEAEKNILLAKERAPGNLEVVYSEAMIYEAQGRFEDAVRVLSSAVTSLKSQTTAAPTNRRSLAILYEQLGRLYTEMEKIPAAVNTFNELAHLGDEEARRAALLTASTYISARDLPHAMEAVDRGLAQSPQDRDLRLTRARVLGLKGDADQAATLLRGMLSRSSQDVEIFLDLAQVYQQNRRYADAEAALGEGGQIATRNSLREIIWFMLGEVYDKEGKPAQAEEQFKKVLAVHPRNAQVLNYYGYMLAERGERLAEATDLIKRALAEDPDNGSYMDSLGWAYYKQDLLAEAEDSLRQAAAREHNDPTILEHLGDVYFKRGKLDLAAAQWDRALEEWRHQMPTDVEPEKVAALEAKISSLKRRIAQQKSNGSEKPQKNQRE
jgi:tetratricopeptide (TPR) repeat protein